MPPGWVNPDGFPYHLEPDGNRFAPHHHLLGCYAAALVTAAAAVESGAAPLVTWLGLSVGLFSFLHLWYALGDYPALGAVGSLLGLFVAGVGLLAVDVMPVAYRLVGLVCVLVALDDVLEHAFGVATPLDRAFKRFIWPLVSR